MNADGYMVSRRRLIAGNILVALGGFMLVASAVAKLAHVPKVVNDLGAMGFEGNRLLMIAILELVSAILFIIPITRSGGLLLVSSYMGGAIATHIQHGHPFIQPAIVLTLLWIGALLRNPQVLWSFTLSSAGRQFAGMQRDADALGGAPE